MPDTNSEVTELVRAFAESWNRHDMAAFSELFAADAHFVNVVGMWWRSRDEIRRAHEHTHATMFRNSRLDVHRIEVREPVHGLAICRSQWTMEGHVSPEGTALPARKGILLFVLRRGADRRWSIIDGQNTDVIEGVFSTPQ